MAKLLRRLGVHISWREILKRTAYEAFWKDNCLSMAAQLAYYFFFALFPTLLFLVAVASYFPVTTLIDDMFRTLRRIPAAGGAADHHRADRQDLEASKNGGLLSLGMLLAVSSSSAAMTAIIDTLNRAYGIEDSRPWWKVRLTAIALTVGVAVFILVSFALILTGPTLATSAGRGVGTRPRLRVDVEDPAMAGHLRDGVGLDRVHLPLRAGCEAGMDLADAGLRAGDDAVVARHRWASSTTSPTGAPTPRPTGSSAR